MVLLVWCFPNLLDFTVGAKHLLEFLVSDGWIQIEHDKSSLVEILLRWVLLGDGVVNVNLSATNHLVLQVLHCILGVANVVIGNHDKATMLALCVHATNLSVLLKECPQLLIVHVATNISNKKRS